MHAGVASNEAVHYALLAMMQEKKTCAPHIITYLTTETAGLLMYSQRPAAATVNSRISPQPL